MGKIILTGDRPTGRLHIGHYVGSLRRRVELQNSGEYDEIYVFIADAQALTDNIDNPEKVRQNVIEVALDYLSVGLDPAKTTIFIQSQIPELCELSFYYMDLVTVARLQRNPTVKQEMALRGFNDSAEGADNKKGTPVGFFTYPISQAADITAFKANIVPVGEDQEPMIEQAREIVRKFNSVYGEVLVEPEILLPDNAACLRLPGTDGKAKMSKSLGNCIYLSDSSEEVWGKVKGMFTDPGHLQVSDPGKVEGNTVFTYLDAFCKPEHFEKFADKFIGKKVSFTFHNLDEVKAQYRAGGLGDMMIKNFLYAVLEDTLSPIRARRAEFEKDIPGVYRMLEEGCRKARAKASQTLDEVRKAMKINYFDDKELIEQQAQSFSNR
ncbi:MAG: tryptophan--tRNA ligase [Bacteroidales bacterium]|nr:tryptophan--tRNA ligase [Candidatus Hennigimonas equi]